MASLDRIAYCPALVGVALALSSLGCHRGLASRIDCQRVLQLRIGQTQDEVRTLLGEPRFAAEQRIAWFNGSPRSDFVFVYSGKGFEGLGTRDEMSVDFLNGQLVAATAYRMRDYVIDHDKGTTALMLGPRDAGYKTASFHEIGPAFTTVFECGAGFSIGNVGPEWQVRR